MSKRLLGIIISSLCLVSIVGIVLITKPSTNKAVQPATNSQNYSLETVAKHSAKDDCWMIINDKVYDLTSFVQDHPGGSEILRGCGKDATALFNTRRDGEERIGSGTPHSSSAKSILDSFYIGELAK